MNNRDIYSDYHISGGRTCKFFRFKLKFKKWLYESVLVKKKEKKKVKYRQVVLSSVE
jgi:hypothetical protein